MRNLLARCARRATALLLVSGCLAATSHAQEPSSESRDDPDKRAACFEAHRNAQELKQKSRFLETREQLLICSRAECPGAIIEDCGSWLSEMEQVTPSMVFEVYVDGKDAPQAKIFVDDVAVQDTASGVKVNPGSHSVRATLPTFKPITQVVTLPAGQRMRLIRFDFESAPVVSAPTDISELEFSRPPPIAMYPLLGVGVVGLGTFGVLAGLGKAEQNKLEDRCAPDCTDDDLSKMKTMYMIGDISAGVGAAALVTAGIVYLARPTKPRKTPQVSLSVDPGRGAFRVSAAGQF